MESGAELMNVGVLTNLFLFGVTILINLIGFIVGNMFLKRIDKLTDSFEKMADKLEQFVKIQDHKDDLGEIRKRIEKLEDINTQASQMSQASQSVPVHVKRVN